MRKFKHYSATDGKVYQGRQDTLAQERLFQKIETVDLGTSAIASLQSPAFACLGFCCDVGVQRNAGRPGAKDGPAALRAQLGNLALHAGRNQRIYDVGDIHCPDADLESAQSALGKVIADLLRHGITPLVFGGGHEIAWGHYQGIYQAFPSLKLGVINFDAHFDLRPLSAEGHGSSGTSFLQIAQQRQQHGLNFDYLCLGIQPAANTRSLLRTAESWNVDYITAEILANSGREQSIQTLKQFMHRVDAIYLSFCLDVMAESSAPGVSAPQVLGLLPQQVLPYLKLILASRKVLSFDVAELAPAYDANNRTARLAAHLVHYVLENYND